MTSELLVEVRGDAVAVLTLHRPERRNAWTASLEEEYFAALDRLDRDPRVRVVVLTGYGSTFCPGFDPDHLKGVQGQPLNQDGRAPAFAPWSSRKPLVVAINGGCAGVGLLQALLGDVRFAARGAKLTTAFTRRGLAGEYGLTWLLPRLIGHAAATELLLSGRTLDADEALRLGLVAHVVEPDDLLDAATAYAAELAAHCSPTSLALVRHQLHLDLDGSFADALGRSYRAMSAAVAGADLAEGVAALTERRAPAFASLDDAYDPAAIVGADVTVAQLLPSDLLRKGSTP